MASLRDTVKDYQDELRDGIAWVAFWKQGRSWNAEYFHLDMDDTLYPEDRSRLEEIKSTRPTTKATPEGRLLYFVNRAQV